MSQPVVRRLPVEVVSSSTGAIPATIAISVVGKLTDKPADAGDTKRRILDAAEELFMEHGFEATSLRLITTAAGVNLAAANYHFGSKEELFQAVFTRRLDPMNNDRMALLAAYEAAPFIREFLSRQYAEMIGRFRAAFGEALPHLPREEVSWRLHFVMGALSYTLAGSDGLKLISQIQPEDVDNDELLLKRLAPFLAAGLRAPVGTAQDQQQWFSESD